MHEYMVSFNPTKNIGSCTYRYGTDEAKGSKVSRRQVVSQGFRPDGRGIILVPGVCVLVHLDAVLVKVGLTGGLVLPDLGVGVLWGRSHDASGRTALTHDRMKLRLGEFVKNHQGALVDGMEINLAQIERAWEKREVEGVDPKASLIPWRREGKSKRPGER